jgi:WD40 repeat protein
MDITSIAISADGQWLAAAAYGDSSVRIFDRAKQQWTNKRLKHRRFVQSLVFSRKGDRLISGGADGKVVFWSVPSFESIATFEAPTLSEPQGDEGIATLKLSPRGDSLSVLTEDGRLGIWRTE